MTASRSLGDRQAELVAALTSGRPVPDGFGAGWAREFAGWAAARPTQGSLRDGWDLARSLVARGALPAGAGAELAAREAGWAYDGATAPKPRRGPALRLAAGSVAVHLAGRVRVIRRP